MSTQSIDSNYAHYWQRLLALLIDYCAVQVGGMFVGLPLWFFIGDNPPISGSVLAGSLGILSIIGIWLYFALMESSVFQATLGKRAIGLFVSDSDLNRITFRKASERFFGKLLSAASIIGAIMPMMTRRKQALHDIIAGTIVIRNP
jgi:uncharacterized RDD family membrane protein YckC